ncbi:MAG: AAA family ATPase [Beijerinckiaceae bacterium]
MWAVEALGAPHFRPVIDLVARSAKLSHATQSPLSIPPLLLVGSPGIGKSFFVRQLAEALATHVERVAMDMLTDRGSMTGLSLSWRAACPGRIASALLEASTASPVFLLDDVDKVSAIHPDEKPLAFLHSVLEPENSSRFVDEYLMIAMRADHSIWLLTANAVDSLAPSILDRLLVFNVQDPSPDALAMVIGNIYAGINARFNGVFEENPPEDIVRRLVTFNPRGARKLLEMAFGYAIERGRYFVTEADVDDAGRLLAEQQLSKQSIGFL